MSAVLKNYDPAELQEILRLHEMWTKGQAGGKPANLRHANLRGANLRGAFLWRANLSNADLSGVNLTVAVLCGARFLEANLTNAQLERADLTSALLPLAALNGANLNRASLKCASLHRANLAGARLIGADFYGTDLTKADLRGAFLDGVDLSRASLIDANFSDSHLERADLRCRAAREAKLHNAHLRNAMLPASAAEARLTNWEASFTRHHTKLLSLINGPEAFDTRLALRNFRAFLSGQSYSEIARQEDESQGILVTKPGRHTLIGKRIRRLADRLGIPLTAFVIGQHCEPSEAGNALGEWIALHPDLIDG